MSPLRESYKTKQVKRAAFRELGQGRGIKNKIPPNCKLIRVKWHFLNTTEVVWLPLPGFRLPRCQRIPEYVARELFDLFAKIYKVRGSECQNNNSEKHCRSSYRVHISHKLMHYSEKMSPRRLIRSRSNARKCSRHVVHRASKFSIFLLLFLWVVAFFSPPPPSPPPGPSRFELYYVSQMHSSLWWHNSSWWLDLGKAAVRTG